MQTVRTVLDSAWPVTLSALLSTPMWQALQTVAAFAREQQTPIYLVGGAVRDVVMGRPVGDLDVTVEGDAVALAFRLSDALAAPVAVHRRFGTAVVRLSGFDIDLASTRSEDYPRPGALPDVRLGAALLTDLGRRDFSMNALALPLRRSAVTVVDPYGGLEDIRRGLVRALHERSFEDDATRALRAARYAGRLGFTIERRTKGWLRRDLDFLNTIGGARLRREICLIAREDRFAAVVRLADRLGIWRAIDSSLELPDTGTLRRFAKLQPALREEAFVALLLRSAAAPDRLRVAKRLALTRCQRGAIDELHAMNKIRRRLSAGIDRPSRIAAMLSSMRPSALEVFVANESRSLAGRRVRRYLDRWRGLRPRIGGKELLALGVRPGPQVGELLTRLRDARLDNETRSRQDELDLIRLTLEQKGSGASR